MRITEQTDLDVVAPGRHRANFGLYLIVSEDSCNRRWAARYTKPSTGKRTEMGLGSAHVITFAAALTKALEVRKDVAEGKDPIEEKRKAKREKTTFADVVEAFITAKEPGWRTDKHARTMRHLLTNHAGALASKSVKAITKDDIEAMLRPILSRSRDQFNRTRAAVYQVFNFADCEVNPADWRRLQHKFPNPKKTPAKHHAAMDYAAEVPEFVRRLHIEQQRNEALGPFIIELILLTGCRTEEITGMLWAEVSFENKLCIIPAERTKTGREHRLPLSDRVVELLTQQFLKSGKGEFVWPSPINGKRPISTKAPYLYLTRTMGVKVTLHGFRSSFRDWAGNETNFDRVTCELALGHQAGDATELAYRRSDALMKRRALMDAWAKYCGQSSVA